VEVHQVRKYRKFESLLAIALAANLSVVSAAAPAIGVAMAKGALSVDSSWVAGNGTVFDGTTIETGRASSDVRLANGVRMTLGAGSRGKFYRDHVLLEKGQGELLSGEFMSGGYRILVRSLQIDSRNSARVSVTSGNRVLVEALNGPLQVSRASGNATGQLVASVVPGHSLELEAQEAGAAAPETMTGCVWKANGHYFLKDEVSGVTVELSGSELEKLAGHRTEVTGSIDPSATPVAAAKRVVRVTNWKDTGKACPAGAPPAAGAAGAGAGTAGAAAGMAIATKAIIVGVVVAAAGTGAAVGLTRSSDSGNTTTPSRPSISQ
jgi:hypothetical protein